MLPLLLLFFGALAYGSLHCLVWLRVWSLTRHRWSLDDQYRTILIVVPHQDDESIMSGGLLIQALSHQVHSEVIYLTDGVEGRINLDPYRADTIRAMRHSEALAALDSVGIPENRVTFLHYNDALGLRSPQNVAKAINVVTEALIRLSPDLVVCPTFEGGHIDHDITHFVVNAARSKANRQHTRFLEGSLYNRVFLCDTMVRFINHWLLFTKNAPPLFPSGSQGFTLSMTSDDLSRKYALYDYFTSQQPLTLRTSFSYPDHYRDFMPTDYSRGPIDLKFNQRYQLLTCLGYSLTKASPYFPQDIDPDFYRTYFQSLREFLSEEVTLA